MTGQGSGDWSMECFPLHPEVHAPFQMDGWTLRRTREYCTGDAVWSGPYRESEVGFVRLIFSHIFS